MPLLTSEAENSPAPPRLSIPKCLTEAAMLRAAFLAEQVPRSGDPAMRFASLGDRCDVRTSRRRSACQRMSGRGSREIAHTDAEPTHRFSPGDATDGRAQFAVHTGNTLPRTIHALIAGSASNLRRLTHGFVARARLVFTCLFWARCHDRTC